MVKIYWSLVFYSSTFNLYGQRVGEDAVDYSRVTDNANLLVVSTYLWGSKVDVDTSDSCGSLGPDINNFFYEDNTHQSSYRRYNRAIGSTFEYGEVDDADSKTDSLVFAEFRYRFN
jgi:hypothetical protein